MPSGPKKRRAARKKNDTDITISINPHQEEKVLVSADMSGMNADAVSDMCSEENSGKESKFADQITLVSPLMDTLLRNVEKGNEDVQVLESVVSMDKESVNDQIIVESSLIDLSSKKTEGNKVVDVGETGSSVIHPFVAEDVEIMCSKEVIEDPLLELHDPSLDSENAHEMVKPIESDSEVNVHISSQEGKVCLKEPLESRVNEPPAPVGNPLEVSSVDHNGEVSQVKKLLERMLRASTEMSMNAEILLSVAKNLSFYLSQLLEEVDSGKLI